MSPDDVTIIIPAYVETARQAARFAAAVSSTYGYRIHIADDASPYYTPRNTEEVTRHAAQRGPGAARNTALAHVTTPYIVPLDADDELLPGAVNALLAEAGPDRIVYGDVLIGEVRHRQQVDLYPLLCGMHPPCVTALYPTAAVRAVGGWREDMDGLEDVELWVRLLEAGYKAVHVEVVTFQYNRQPDGRSARMDSAALWQRIHEAHQETWRTAMACKCGRKPAKTETPVTNPAFVSYVGKRSTPFGYRGSVSRRHYHVMPGEPLAVEQGDRQAMLESGLFQPAQDTQPDQSVAAARRAAWRGVYAYLGDSREFIEIGSA